MWNTEKPRLATDGFLPSEIRAEPYDIFISYAAEDRETVAKPLFRLLAEKGLRIWFDEMELRVGDHIHTKVTRGITISRYGLVIISKNFMKKEWTRKELDMMLTKSMSLRKCILPVWHEVSKEVVLHYCLELAGIFALKTSDSTLAEIADNIAGALMHSNA